MYYSERHNPASHTDHCSQQFWNSYLAYLRKLVSDDYLFEKFGDFNTFDNIYTTAIFKFEEEMLIKLGSSIDIYKLTTKNASLPSSDFQLDMLEFVFQYVSKPIDYEFDNYYSTKYANKFDVAKGRYDYTVTVNDIFQRNRISFKLDKGKIVKYHDEILDSRLQCESISFDDKLNREVQQAINLFFSRDSANIKTALTVIANAFELAKTLAYPMDKRKSISEICKNITSDREKLTEIFSGHFLYLTDISNYCDIRHKETGKIIIDDLDLQEYLFYSYYNAIRLIARKIPPPF
ncbi:MAG: hypothetical protein Q7J10_10405 [Methanosarcinaceae archaeon]|nr:hypothetical protein [Methanosarcinaceae archaeon]